MAVTVTIVTAGLLTSVETEHGWALVGLGTITAGAVLLHLTQPEAQTTSRASHEARR